MALQMSALTVTRRYINTIVASASRGRENSGVLITSSNPFFISSGVVLARMGAIVSKGIFDNIPSIFVSSSSTSVIVFAVNSQLNFFIIAPTRLENICQDF